MTTKTGIDFIFYFLTLINFIWSISKTFSPSIGTPLSSEHAVLSLPFRILAFILLQLIVSYSFCGLIHKTQQRIIDKPQSLVASAIVVLISAKVSIFNLQWLLIGPYIPYPSYLSRYVTGSIFANAMGTIMLMSWRKDENIDHFLEVFVMHGIPYAIMAFSLTFS